MQFQYTPYILPLIATALISGWVAVYSWSRRANTGAIALALLATAITEWSIGYALEIAGADLATKLFWGKSQYIGIVLVPLLWVGFAFHHANQAKRLKMRTMGLLAIIPIITLFLALTTESHGLVWNKFGIIKTGDFSALKVSYGFWFWIHTAYSYIMLLIGTVIVIRSIGRMTGIYRRQAAVLLLAVMAPWLGNTLYIARISPIPNLDLTPFAFTISVVAFTWGIFGFQLVDLSPIARTTVIDEMSTGMIVIDIGGRIVDINPSALKTIGQSGSQVIGRRAVDVLTAWPDLTKKYSDIMEATDEITFGEGESQRWYELRLAPLHDKHNEIVGRVITINNITNQKRTGIRLQESKARYRQIVENAASVENDDLLTLLGEQIDANRDNLIGRYRQSLKETLFTNRSEVHPRDLTRIATEEADTLIGSFRGPFSHVMEHGARLCQLGLSEQTILGMHQAKLRFILDNFESNLLAYALDAADIYQNAVIRGFIQSREKLILNEQEHIRSAVQIALARYTTELKESEERYRQIVENASDIIYRTDNNGYFTYANPIALRSLGFRSEAEVLGKHFLELASPHLREDLKVFYERQYVAKEKNSYYEFIAIATDGREIWLGQNVQTIEDNGNIIGFQALARDITELKRTQEALSLARDQALEASRLKSQLLAKVSHELRTPLGGILGYAELMQINAFGKLAEKQKNAVTQIIDSTHYLTKLVNELLDEAQIEAKTVKLFIDHFSPTELLHSIKTSTAVLIQQKGLELVTTIDPNLPKTLYGDEQRLQQILVNLVGNAIKFTKNGKIHIKLFHPHMDYWSMQVSDTGLGIPKEAQEYIFEPFRQVDTSNTYENRGTGLGLSIAKQLVDLMNGQITLESEVGKGSTFTILLPIRKAAKELS